MYETRQDKIQYSNQWAFINLFIITTATALDRKFRIDVVCEKYPSKDVTCGEVPCAAAWCAPGDERNRDDDDKQKDKNKPVNGGVSENAKIKCRALIYCIFFIIRSL